MHHYHCRINLNAKTEEQRIYGKKT